ncbi:MAG: hypothetical protein WD960_07595 [Gemmatimonadota bacterium]
MREGKNDLRVDEEVSNRRLRAGVERSAGVAGRTTGVDTLD